MTYVSFSNPSAVIILDPLTAFLSPQVPSTQDLIKHAQDLSQRYPHRSEAFCLHQAYTTFFSEDALEAFATLVKRVSAQFQAVIVLTSEWGNSVSSTKELQELLPNKYPFNAHVVDAVQFAPDWAVTQSKPATEGQLIDHWLCENAETRQIRRIIIIGHFDQKEEVGVRFNPFLGFTHHSRSINKEDMEQAYSHITHQSDFQICSLLSNKETKRMLASKDNSPCALL